MKAIIKVIFVYLICWGCASTSVDTNVVEKNKMSAPSWIEEKLSTVEPQTDGTLKLFVRFDGASTIDQGVEGALSVANTRYSEYVSKLYFTGLSTDALKDSFKGYVSEGFRQGNTKKLYEICDIYYEKRHASHSILDASKEEQSYDTYLCLKVKNPQKVIADVELETKKNRRGRNKDVQLAH